MEIKRIDAYDDTRFSKSVLLQHGCFLVDEVPYEVEIISASEAVVRGADQTLFPMVIDETAGDWVCRFVAEAQKRNVYTPKDMMLVSHEEYVEKWYRFCDEIFADAEE